MLEEFLKKLQEYCPPDTHLLPQIVDNSVLVMFEEIGTQCTVVCNESWEKTQKTLDLAMLQSYIIPCNKCSSKSTIHVLCPKCTDIYCDKCYMYGFITGQGIFTCARCSTDSGIKYDIKNFKFAIKQELKHIGVAKSESEDRLELFLYLEKKIPNLPDIKIMRNEILAESKDRDERLKILQTMGKRNACTYCEYCLRLHITKKCSNCKLVNYCNIDCQHRDWSVHKKLCSSNHRIVES
jgi:hypothetical protein